MESVSVVFTIFITPDTERHILLVRLWKIEQSHEARVQYWPMRNRYKQNKCMMP